VSGACTGDCAPGQVQCTGQQPQNCSAAGTWQSNGNACIDRQTCIAGTCSGVDCSTYTEAVCNGNATCDLNSNTCCVLISLTPTGRCVANGDAGPNGDPCNSNEAAYHCRYACDCVSGDSCCGVFDTSTLSGSANCQFLADGGACTVQTGTQTAAQLCEQDAECKNGAKCIAQTCIFNSQFKFCGLQTEAPYRCTANPTDAGGQ
jgi:hypothetical protein